EAKEGAEREHMVGIAAAVGMVATDRDVALMIEQRIEHMQRLARRCRDQLGEERPVAVGEMGVDLEPRLLAVMSIETAGGTAEPTGLEELPVGRRSSTAPEYRRKRLTLLLIDQTSQRQGIRLLADVPVGHPGELAEAGDAARFGHASQQSSSSTGSG